MDPYMNQNKNPIYIEWYSHENCECYKINLPWSLYNKHTVVLCKVSDGIECAKEKAKILIAEHFKDAISEPMTLR